MILNGHSRYGNYRRGFGNCTCLLDLMKGFFDRINSALPDYATNLDSSIPCVLVVQRRKQVYVSDAALSSGAGLLSVENLCYHSFWTIRTILDHMPSHRMQIKKEPCVARILETRAAKYT